ncbi:MAG: hypothetical protein ACOC05_06410 [Oceanicaulis sp.]
MLRFLFPAAGAGLGALVLQACAAGAGMEPEMSPAAAEALSGFTPTGETASCLNTRRIDTIDPLDDRHWLVETVGGERYLNVVGPGCNDADSNFTFLQYDTTTGQLCRGEIVRVIDNGSSTPRGSCGLGDYQRLAPVQ